MGELRFAAKQLQGAALTFMVMDARLAPQGAQTVAAVLGDAHHPRFVDGILRFVAVLQHLPHPLQLKQRAVGA